MKINIELLGLPMVSELIGKKKLDLEVPAGTVKAVVDELIRRYGKKVGEAIFDSDGNFDLSIQVALNGKSFIAVDQHHETLIKDGDTLALMLLLAGG